MAALLSFLWGESCHAGHYRGQPYLSEVEKV